MALWGNVDDAANSTIFAASQVNKTANTTNRALLFSNTTADAFITNATIGQFGFDTTEQQVSSGGPSHSGWVLRTEGSGGRAGRVFYETLVAMGSMSDDAEDVVGKDYKIIILSNPQPEGMSANATNNDTKSFTANAYTIPAGGVVSYSWQYSIDNGDTWTNANGQTGFNNALTSTLSVSANAFVDGDSITLRAVLSNAAAASVTTATALLEITG
jgi:hypothetical protein